MEPAQIAIAVGLFALLIDKGLVVLKNRGVDLPVMARQIRELSDLHIPTAIQQTQELHDWHKVTDQDGVKIWYLRRSLTDAVEQLADNTNLETKLLEKLIDRVATLDARISQLEISNNKIRN